MWVPITKENIKDLKVGDRIRYSNGYEWCEDVLTQFWIDRGYIGTGLHNETANFLNPMFGKCTYVWRWRPGQETMEPKEILKLRCRLLAKAKQTSEDPPLYHVDQEWMDPPEGSYCWVFDTKRKYVAKGKIDHKNPSHSRDYSDTWSIVICHVEENMANFMSMLMDTFCRFQIHPTKNAAYIALYGYLEDRIEEKENNIKDLRNRCHQIERHIKW